MSNGSQKQGAGGSLMQFPVATVFGLLVLAALAYLIATRIFFGSIRIEAGTRLGGNRMDIEWGQVIIAFIAGVIMSAMVKGAVSSLRSKVSGA